MKPDFLAMNYILGRTLTYRSSCSVLNKPPWNVSINGRGTVIQGDCIFRVFVAMILIESIEGHPSYPWLDPFGELSQGTTLLT